MMATEAVYEVVYPDFRHCLQRIGECFGQNRDDAAAQISLSQRADSGAWQLAVLVGVGAIWCSVPALCGSLVTPAAECGASGAYFRGDSCRGIVLLADFSRAFPLDNLHGYFACCGRCHADHDSCSLKIEKSKMNYSVIDPQVRAGWQVPSFETQLWLGRQHPWCVVIPVINEGERVKSLLARMFAFKIDGFADVIIVDGGSTDGSLALASLQENGVRGLLLKTGSGKLSAQLRCAYAFALEQGYEGIVTIDGNDKDDPEAIPRFIEALKQGVDFVQASRFISGGIAENTPKLRDFAIRFIHAPMLSLFSGFHWTDTTQGFRAYSRKMLLDARVAPFRDVFSRYELLAYLSYRIPKLGYRCVELPTVRRYPILGDVPTKISGIKGNWSVLVVLFRACFGAYNSPSERTGQRHLQ